MPFKRQPSRRRRAMETPTNVQVVEDMRGAVYALTAPLRVRSFVEADHSPRAAMHAETTDGAYDLAVPLHQN